METDELTIDVKHVIPDSRLHKSDSRPAAVLIKLLTEPELAAAAVKAEKAHGSAFIAYLMGQTRLDDLKPESLEEAFRISHLASFNSWEEARETTAKIFIRFALERRQREPEFKEDFDPDPIRFLGGITRKINFVDLGSRVYAFGNPNDVVINQS